MKKIAILLLAVCMLLPALTACSGEPENGFVDVFNWGEYIDKSIFKDFEKEYGIRVRYSEFPSNEDLYSQLRFGGANFDVVIPSDYMIARMIEENMLAPLDFNNIPNFNLIDPRYKNLEFDPGNRYSVAYMVGTVGLIYNSEMVPFAVDSWGALFDERLSRQILMFDNPRDAFAIALKYLGYYINTTNEDEIHEAFELLLEHKPLFQGFVMDQIFDKLTGGEAAIGPYYAGDFITMYEDNPSLRFARPKEGTNFFVDAMVIPANAENKENAEKFINFMSRTDIAFRNMDYIWYASANYEAAALFADEVDPEFYDIIFANDEVLANSTVFTNLPQHILKLYDELWIRLKS